MEYRARITIGASLAGALLFATSATALADEQPGEALYYDEIADDAGDLTAGDVTDEDLRMFLIAAESVQAVRAAHAPGIAAVDPEDVDELVADAAVNMADAVEATGLEVEEFRRIGYLVQNDDGIRDRLNDVAGSV